MMTRIKNPKKCLKHSTVTAVSIPQVKKNSIFFLIVDKLNKRKLINILFLVTHILPATHQPKKQNRFSNWKNSFACQKSADAIKKVKDENVNKHITDPLEILEAKSMNTGKKNRHVFKVSTGITFIAVLTTFT